MIDFETLDNKPTSVLLSLGAVLFTSEGIVSKKYWEFDIQSQIDARRSISESTILWWLSQDMKAREVFSKYDKDGFPKQRLKAKDFFSEWRGFMAEGLMSVKLGADNFRIWGNGANFDVVAFENFCFQYGQVPFWAFWNVRCYRTIKNLSSFKELDRKGVFHNALDDSIHQANCLINWPEFKGLK